MQPEIKVEAVLDRSAEPAVRGFLHVPSRHNGSALVLTHGAGANCQSKLLIALSHAFAAAGLLVLRCDLPFRQIRPHGPPFPAMAARDRDGLRRAVQFMKQRTSSKVFLGGHSYGGRQASMLAAEEADLASGLLLFSYPLHPPRKPNELRTAHFVKLHTAVLFVHGSRDPFGSIAEMTSALQLIPAPTHVLEIKGTGHELMAKNGPAEVPSRVVEAFEQFLCKQSPSPAITDVI